MAITTTLKERSLELIKSATSLDDVAYLVKGLGAAALVGSTILSAVEAKVTELSPTATAREMAYISTALATYEQGGEIYKLGIKGTVGYGVATCPPSYIPSGWTAKIGHDVIGAPNYGNYIDANGSTLVYTPKHYYKYTGNEIDTADQPTAGYVLDRSFINGGKEMKGVFIYKYGASNLNGIFASVKGADPVSTSSAHNPISGLTGAYPNRHGGLYAAAKGAGAGYYLTSIFNYSMLARIALAHGKAATSTAQCAYIDVAPLMPKGCLVSALKDVNDSSVTYASSRYSDCGLTGSGSPFAKTTHNGQDCGIADLNGNMWEVASGFTLIETVAGTPASTDFRILLESADITAIVDDTTTAGTGAYDMALYEQIDLAGIVDAPDGWTYLGNGVETVFAMTTDRTLPEYKKTSLGIPNATGTSTSGTTEFGNDGVYRYLRNEMACIVGGNWSYSSYAGVSAMLLNDSRAYSSDVVGGRASYLV